MYVAGKNLKVVRAGKTIDLQVNDPFPEAPTLPTFKHLLNAGFAIWMPDGQPVAGVSPDVVAAAKVNGLAKK